MQGGQSSNAEAVQDVNGDLGLCQPERGSMQQSRILFIVEKDADMLVRAP